MPVENIITHQPRSLSSSQQDLMPARYGLPVQILSMLAFGLAFFGWFNETWLMWFENPIWLNRYTEYGIILAFGVWRIVAEKNAYTRRRLIILVSMVTVLWWLAPWLYPVYEPYVGFLWGQPVFPSIHVPGTITFFLILAAVFLFGRRIVCGFNCPCVGIRETVGFAFRDRTLRSNWSWALRHSKWFFFLYYVGVMVTTQFPPNAWTVSFVGGFYLLVALTYFGSFFIAPLVGNRFYCRYLCPYGATFGLLNHAGFYGINMDKDKCNDCGRCEQVCDMGIPVWHQGQQSGRITAIEDCMGCARCVVSCPTDALEITDVRNLFKKSLVQNASHLLKQNIPAVTQRKDVDLRTGAERNKDWLDINKIPDLLSIQAQASRCLDCGSPGCINACPLHNRIPEWLEQVAAGNINKAASIAHSTSNLPEICGTLCPQHRLCEGACTKNNAADGGAVTIGAIESYLSRSVLANEGKDKIKITAKKIALNRSVAIIGAGPAGLACADELSKAGCDVTVYDREKKIGGLMETGVPSFKLDKSMLQKRYQLLQQQGVGFELGVVVNEQRLQQLLHTHDAIFLGTGAQTSRKLQCGGQKLQGVSNAISYLAQVNQQPENATIAGKKLVIIGGGDSAMDCARSAVRQGAASVTVAYRGAEEKMRASPKEKQAALDEGVKFLFNYLPVEILGTKSVTAMLFNHNNSTMSICCDAVVFAAGQVNKAADWMTRMGIETSERGAIIINKQGCSSHKKIYAGGDNTHGPDLVVTAIVAGRRAADGILKSFSLVATMKQNFSWQDNEMQPLVAATMTVHREDK
jgi:glutamate synthase (NADPH/NADH) small chain